MNTLIIECRGLAPVPKGGMRCVGKRLFWSNSKRLTRWREHLGAAIDERKPWQPIDGIAVGVVIDFYIPRPATARGDQRSAHYVSKRPDIDKLARAVLDELSGRIIVDDSQVAVLVCSKEYIDDATQGGCDIKITAPLPTP